jgi:excisionase family DNA binding protein
MRRDEAAASLGISATKFDELVAEGKMPKGIKIGAMRLFDTEQVRDAWLQLRDAEAADNDDGPNPFDENVA